MFLELGLLLGLAVGPLRLGLASEGDVLAWLVSGPYPNLISRDGRATGFDVDYLGGEGSVDPIESAAGQPHGWRLATGDVAHGVDLKAIFRTDDPGIAYCFTSLQCSRPHKGHLLFGSDDGAKVYLNGALIYSRDIKRGVKRDEENVPLDLTAGENRLLFKVEQYDGGWGLMARIVSETGSAIADVHQVLRIESDRTDASPIRRFAGKPGSLDLEALQRYEQVRSEASLFLERLRARAADPNHLERVLDSAAAAVEGARDNSQSASQAVARGATEIRDAYTEARRPLLEWAQNPGPCVSTDPAREDYVRVMPGGRYFVHADGSPFIPISINHNPDWSELEESNPLRPAGYDPEVTERWFGNLQSHGVNVVRLMVETPPSGNLEERVGTFRPEHVIWLDDIFHCARRHGVKLWITPYDTFWMSRRKETSPYWRQNGGPIDKPVDFLTKPEILDAQERRMKLLIDRYGNTGSVFAWEIMNEVDLWWDASPGQIKAWTDRMAAYVRGYEHRRWGRNHMLTISFANPEPYGLNAETAFQRTDLDFATMHLYVGASRDPKPGEALQAALDFASGVVYARKEIRDNRPVLDGESGPIDRWIDDEAFDDEVFHEMSWMHLMSGGAGSGTRWPYRNPHRVTYGMLQTLRSMREFCDGVPWASMIGHTAEFHLYGPAGSTKTVFATANGAIAWVRLPKGGEDRTVSLELPNASVTSYRCFDVIGKRWLTPGPERGSGVVKVTPPVGVNEVAFWLQVPSP